MMRNALWVVAVVAVVASFGMAQVTTGTPPHGSFRSSGVDTINLANLNVHVDIPVLSKAGRGLPFNYTLSYDSSVWYPATVGSSRVWQPVYNWGWRASTEIALGYVSYRTKTGKCFDGEGGWWYATFHFGYVYHDTFGTPHPLNWGFATCDGESGDGTATDNSGYRLDGVYIYDRSGGKLQVPFNSGTGDGFAQDNNGNRITLTGSNFTDSLGRTALSVSGASPNPISFTYEGPQQNVSVTMYYVTRSIQTSFGCTGVSEYSGSAALVDHISLPDGNQYTFTYEQTPGYQNIFTGRIASVTLPTGATIAYAYTGANNGVICADGSAAGLNRTTPDGTEQYVRSGSGSTWTTTITHPNGGPQGRWPQTVINFQGLYETQRQVYAGSLFEGTLLGTSSTCYNGNLTNCNTTAVTTPITRKTIVLQKDTLQSKQDIYYSGGLVTDLREYDYGTGNPGPLKRKTLYTYQTFGTDRVRPTAVTVQDGSGHTLAETTYGYDMSGVTGTSGTPQHVAVSGARGNLTAITQTGALGTQRFTYFDTGTVETATDVNGAQTIYTYGACGNSFVTNVSLPLSLSRSMAWNCAGGVITSATDENQNISRTTYSDPYFWRPTQTSDKGGNLTTITYPTINGAHAVQTSMSFNSSVVEMLTTLDSLGRTHLVQRRQCPLCDSYDSVQIDYDTRGRSWRRTLPYSGIAGQTSSSGPAVTTGHDPLGRTTSVSDSGGGYVYYTYSNNDVLVNAGPAASGENTKRKQLEHDALGRLTSVCEITAGSGSWLGGACSQTTSQTGYWTKYNYDVPSHVGQVTVTQNAQSATNQQNRTYNYDLLGRITSEVNPETGTTTYVYDTDATCGTSYGDLVKRTDAVGNVTCYAYDSLHRMTAITYPSGSYASVTPEKHFVYDSATVNGTLMVNAEGRLAEAYTGPSNAKITDLGYSYTARGEVSDVHQYTPHSVSYYHVTAGYRPHGALSSISGVPGLPNLYYGASDGSGLDGEGRLTKVTVPAPYQWPVSTVGYDPNNGTLTGVTYGSGDFDTFTYDPLTLRLSSYASSIGNPAQTASGTLTWNTNGSLQQLATVDPFNAANTQTCNYAHDDLGRIANVACGTTWQQTSTFDPFGNITKTGSQSFTPGYNPATNRINSGYSATYDNNGNLTNDGMTPNATAYTWDADGNPHTIVRGTTVTVTYDALGRAVENDSGGNFTQILYGPGGGKLALMNGQNLQKAFVPLPGGGQAVYDSTGLAYYRHTDLLGSSRLTSTSTRSYRGSVAYAPYGEDYAPGGTSDLSFTGQNQDTISGLYDFMFRRYNPVHGRWISPDPAGMAAVNPANPQSWNLYAYVANNPLASIDPLGLTNNPVGYCYYDGSGNLIYCDSSGGGGGGEGGDSYPPLENPGYCGPWNPSCGLGEGAYGSMPDWVLTGHWSEEARLRLFGDPCVYLNNAGNGVESVDHNSTPGECNATGGQWVPPQAPGTTYGIDAHGNAYPIISPALEFLCKSSPTARIFSSMGFGAIIGGSAGAYTGFVSGEILFGSVSLGTSGAGGAAVGGVVGGVLGATRGVFTGFALAEGCQAAGAYNFGR